jgi:hypothetical protein
MKQIGIYVGKILKGAKASDLPIVQLSARPLSAEVANPPGPLSVRVSGTHILLERVLLRKPTERKFGRLLYRQIRGFGAFDARSGDAAEYGATAWNNKARRYDITARRSGAKKRHGGREVPAGSNSCNSSSFFASS